MTSSSTDPEQPQLPDVVLIPKSELEDLKAKVALLQAEVAALRASQPVTVPVYVPYPAAPAPYYPPHIYWYTAGASSEIPPLTYSGAAAPLTYGVQIPAQAAAAQPFPWQQLGGDYTVTSQDWLASTTSSN